MANFILMPQMGVSDESAVLSQWLVKEGDKIELEQPLFSMETGKSVNDLVGDRILLTMLISFFTIIFTWAVALPIGIYSAVRPYSFADYVCTVIGFLGMCVPGFLLALILMALTGINSLFSAQYAIQPYWPLTSKHP